MISYSSDSMLKKCPRQFYEVRVLKNHPYVAGPEAKLGDWIHQRLEAFGKTGEVVPRMPPELTAHLTPERITELRHGIDWAQGIIAHFSAQGGHLLFEQEFNTNPELTTSVPKDYRAKYNWTGKADLIEVRGTHALVGDWKTGGSRFPDTDQLELMAVFTFIAMPEVQSVDGGLLFLGDQKIVTSPLWRRDLDFPLLRAKWLARFQELFDRSAKRDWPATKNPLCAWCPCRTCEHNAPARAAAIAKGKKLPT